MKKLRSGSGTWQMSAFQSALKATLMVSIVGLAVPVAHADDEKIPLYLSMSETLEHDNNVTRETTNKRADTISSTAVQFGLDKSYGRQHYNVNATVSKDKYKNLTVYDNDSYNVAGTLSSEIGSDFQLSANGSTVRELPKFEDNSVNRQARNIRRGKSMGADLRYGLYGRVSANVGFSTDDNRYDVSIDQNRSAHSINVGVRYLPNELMYYGLGYTRTAAEYSNRYVEYVGDDGFAHIRTGEEVTRNNVSLSAYWQVTGFSLFSGSLGVSDESNKYDRLRDFKGVTGAASWRFTPPGRVTYLAKWSRDTNNQGGSTDFTGAGVNAVNVHENSNNRLTNNYSLTATYEATAKLKLTANYAYILYKEEEVRTGENEVTPQARNGRYAGYSLGFSYRPLDSLGLGCNRQSYDRTQSQFTRAYSGLTYSCYASFTIQ